jgi:L-threonylcarbamoyladenylate synthase
MPLLRISIAERGFTENDLELAAAVLASGGLGIMPTDTVYGLVALAENADAVARLFDIKGRPADKPLPIQVAKVEDADRLTYADAPEARRLMEAFWPGPITLVMKLRPGPRLPHQDPESLGIRIPDCAFCLALIERAGFLVVPSANFSGEPAPVSLDGVSGDLQRLAGFVVDGGACPVGLESTVVDLTSGLEILREGAIPEVEVSSVARG